MGMFLLKRLLASVDARGLYRTQIDKGSTTRDCANGTEVARRGQFGGAERLLTGTYAKFRTPPAEFHSQGNRVIRQWTEAEHCSALI
jgi:hypothetical protein